MGLRLILTYVTIYKGFKSWINIYSFSQVTIYIKVNVKVTQVQIQLTFKVDASSRNIQIKV